MTRRTISKHTLRFGKRSCKGSDLDCLANDIDDMLFDADPYGYLDDSEQVGLTFEETRIATRRGIRGQLQRKDRELLEGLRAKRSDYEGEPGHGRTVRRFDRMIRRTEKFFRSK